jgi:hypothetical protein
MELLLDSRDVTISEKSPDPVFQKPAVGWKPCVVGYAFIPFARLESQAAIAGFDLRQVLARSQPAAQ